MIRPAKNTLLDSLLLVITVGLAYLWTNNPQASGYSLQLISLLVIIYLGVQFISRKVTLTKSAKIMLDVAILTLVTFLIIFSTGALFSPLFFLIYFLLFGIALLFEPSSAVILAVIATIFFLFTPRKEIFEEFLQLASLFLITPLALIFGTQYIQLLQSTEKIKILAAKDRALEKEVDIQENQVKSWTEGEFKVKLAKIWQEVEDLAKNPECGTKHKLKLQQIAQTLTALLESGKKMEEKIQE